MSDSLWPCGLQNTRLCCPSPSPRVCSELVMPSNHLLLCHPFLLLPSIFPSIRVFSNELALCIRWPKYWSFSFVSPSNEYSGLISFRMDWFDLLAVQGTLKSLLQHYRSKASILQRSAFFMAHFSHPYTTTGKTVEKESEQNKILWNLQLGFPTETLTVSFPLSAEILLPHLLF